MTHSPPTPRPARTAAEYVVLARRLKAWSGLSYRQLAQRATARGDHLPASTLATALRRNSLPAEPLLTAFVRACGCDEATVDLWIGVRRRLAMDAATVPDTSTARAGSIPPDALAAPETPTARSGHTMPGTHTMPDAHTARSGHTLPGTHPLPNGHALPGDPARPNVLATPGTPATRDAAARPGVPGLPSAPAAPDGADASGVLAVPGAPAAPGVAARSGVLAVPDAGRVVGGASAAASEGGGRYPGRVRVLAVGAVVVACTAGSVPVGQGRAVRTDEPRPRPVAGELAPGWYRIHTDPDGRCLGVRPDRSRRALLFRDACRPVPEQRFYFERSGGHYRIRAGRPAPGSHCLTVGSAEAGKALQVRACLPSEPGQRVLIEAVPGKRHRWLPTRLMIRAVADPGSRVVLSARAPEGRPDRDEFGFYLTAEE